MSDAGFATRSWVLLLATTLLFGCASQPKRLAPVLKEADKHNRKGVRAEGEKSFSTAETEFAESYRLYSSVENYRGMVISLINSSRLYRASRDVERAEAVMNLAVGHIANAPMLEAEVSFEKAKILLLVGRVEEAMHWGEKALNSASDHDRPRMLNLSAEIFRKRGLAARAGQFAEEAISLSRKGGDLREEANAQRLIGELELHEKRFAAARDRFTLALAIDKELGLSHKISEDLEALSQAYDSLGESLAASAHLQRAVDVILAHGDRQQAIILLEKLRLLQERNGQKEAAAKTEELRQRLQQEKR